MKKTNENKKQSRFENKETIVKGFIVDASDPSNVVTTPFEETVSYVRAANRAIEMIRERMGITEDKIFVTVTEIINEKAEPIRYSNSKLVDFAVNIFDSEEEANAVLIDGCIVKKVSIYNVSGVVWSIDGAGDYYTNAVNFDTPVNITKADARAFVKMQYESLTGENVLALHDIHKTEIERFAVINKDDLEKCIIIKESK